MFSPKVCTALKIILIKLLLDACAADANQKTNGRSMEFTAVSNKYNKAYISNYTAWITNHTLNVELRTVTYLSYGLMAEMDLQIKLQDSQSYQSLLRYFFDICKLLNENFREGLFRTNFKNILKYGNFMENCPIPEGRYFLKNFILEPLSIPVYLRPGDYRVILNLRYKKDKSKAEDFFAFTQMDMRIF